jgi:hypothetical protein
LSTAAQVAANRANAHFRTGPKTVEGKAKSCLNAVKTGRTGPSALLLQLAQFGWPSSAVSFSGRTGKAPFAQLQVLKLSGRTGQPQFACAKKARFA